MRRLAWFVGLVGCLVAGTEAGEFEGRWRVLAQQDVGAKRTLEERSGRLKFVDPPVLPGEKSPRSFQGSSLGDKAELSSQSIRGVAQALLDQENVGSTVRLSLKLIRRGETLQARVTYRRDGQVVLREYWEREQAPLIELISVWPRVNYDPKRDGSVFVRFRIKGEAARRVRLKVELPQEAGPRYTFYSNLMPQRAGGDGFAVVRGQAQTQEPGEHTLELSGRDDTEAQRILLAGTYRLVLTLEGVEPAIGRVEGSLTVAPPRAEHLVPQWLAHPSHDLDGNPAVYASPDATKRQRGLGKGLRMLGSQTPGPQTHLAPDDFGHRMGRAASVVIDTHGYTEGISTYLPTGDEVAATGFAQKLELPAGTFYIDGRVLRESLPAVAKPLKDLHYVLIYSCETGKGDFTGDLIKLGVDLVVAFTREVPTSEGPFWTERLFNNLAGNGEGADPPHSLLGGKPIPGVRSLGWAAREAASFADGAWFAALSAQDKERVRRVGWLQPLQSSITIHTAEEIDADREQALPARYGNSTN